MTLNGSSEFFLLNFKLFSLLLLQQNSIYFELTNGALYENNNNLHDLLMKCFLFSCRLLNFRCVYELFVFVFSLWFGYVWMELLLYVRMPKVIFGIELQ